MTPDEWIVTASGARIRYVRTQNGVWYATRDDGHVIYKARALREVQSYVREYGKDFDKGRGQ